MILPAPQENETAFGYYRRLIGIAGGRHFLNKEEREIVSSAIYESLEANLGHYHLKGETLEELEKANKII